MGHQSNARGTLRLDRRFPGVGRLARATGTRDPRMLSLYDGMLTALYAAGRLDILRAIKDGLSFAEVWEHYRPMQGRPSDLNRLPSPEAMQRLWARDENGQEAGALETWLAGHDVVAETKANHRSKFAQLRKVAGPPSVDPAATIADVPALLAKYRRSVLARPKPPRRQYNMVRIALQAFLRGTVGHRSPIYGAVADMEPMSVTRKPTRGLKPDEARAVCLALNLRTTGGNGEAFWALCLTGMRPKEFFTGAWQILDDASLFIAGTKTERHEQSNARRTIPLIDATALHGQPRIAHTTFKDRMWMLQSGQPPYKQPYPIPVTPYTARRTFAHWMEMAKIPRSRRKLYMGQTAGDVLDLYEQHELDEYRRQDAAALRAYLGLNDDGPAGLRLVKEA